MNIYFLFYKHYKIAWARKNFSCIILPNGSSYSCNNPNSNEDILGCFKGEIPTHIPLQTRNKAIKLGELIETNIPLEVNIQNFKSVKLTKDSSTKISDGGFELYALFKYDANQNTYEYIPLQILDTYYFRNYENDSFNILIEITYSYKTMIPVTTTNNGFYKNGSQDDETFIGKK